MTSLVKNQTMLAELNNASQQDMAIGDSQLARRTFCRDALIGSSLLGQPLWKSGFVLAQEDEPDSPELLDLISIGGLVVVKSADPDEPEVEDLSTDDFQVFLSQFRPCLVIY